MNKTSTPLLLLAVALSGLAFLRPAASEARATTAVMADGSIAVVALPSLMNELMQSDRFLPDRTAYEQELNDELQAMADELRAFSERHANLQPDDPGAEGIVSQFGEMRRRLGEKQGENTRKIEAFTVRQIKECNELVRSSAKAVADDLGFEYVVASSDPDEGLTDQSVELLLRQLTARPMIMFPEDNDITSDVRDDLNLE